jgi:serine/threonine-protein kinase CTR1
MAMLAPVMAKDTIRVPSSTSTAASSCEAYDEPPDFKIDLKSKAKAIEDDWDCDAKETSIGEVYVSHNRPVSELAVNGFEMDLQEVSNIKESELTLLKRLGNGGTAEVYKGYWRGKLVAIKEMRLSSAHKQNMEMIAFKREMGILCKAKHPNLVQLHAASFDQQPWRIVMELCSGGCLFEAIHTNEIEFSWAQKLKMATDIAKGMDYLHNFPPPVIHRDLKSLNLLLAEEVMSSRDLVTAKVSDFGLSRVMAGNNTRMTPGAGTLNWMAPEVMKGEYYDEKVDVYSYAMVLFEIICSEVPFEDEEDGCVPSRVVEGHRPDLEAIPPETPRWIGMLMIEAWSQAPSERPSFSSILKVLQAASP